MAQKYGYLANLTDGAQREFTCLVCDTLNPTYSWTDYSGEGYCTRCGTTYQLKWGELKEGESYPRINVRKEAIPALRRFYQDTKTLNGCGTYLSFSEYPEQLEGRKLLNEWFEKHISEYPELTKQDDAEPLKEE